MNNTAIVAIMLPVTLGFARSKNISVVEAPHAALLLFHPRRMLHIDWDIHEHPSKWCAARSGGEDHEHVRAVTCRSSAGNCGHHLHDYLRPRMIPDRTSITGSLEIEWRTTPLYHLLIQANSSLIGQNLMETILFKKESGIQVIEIRRDGARLMLPVQRIIVKKNDRFLIAMQGRKGPVGKPEEVFAGMGAESPVSDRRRGDGTGDRDESSLHGVTLAASDFRQHYNSVVLAVHRNGVNITDKISNLPLEVGDTLLVITPRNNLEALEATRTSC